MLVAVCGKFIWAYIYARGSKKVKNDKKCMVANRA